VHRNLQLELYRQLKRSENIHLPSQLHHGVALLEIPKMKSWKKVDHAQYLPPV
jgi:hypothetical protein